MLGKLIKNEFIQRGKQVTLIFAALLAMSGVTALLWMIEPHIKSEDNFFRFFVVIVTVIFSVGIFAASVGCFMLCVGDFGKRLFKDQGYLTHTLPVKISSIMIARMVFDIVLVIAMTIIFPIAICIAARDFTFFDSLFKELGELTSRLSGGALETSIVIFDIILSCVAMLLSALSGIWMFNAAYAIGHSFNSGKKGMSVVAYIVIAIIYSTISYFIGWLMNETSLGNVMINGLDSSLHPEVYLMVMLIFMCVLSLVSVVIFAAIASFICKKKLNLE